MTQCSVAIDGPSGAGKSTLARAAARDLNFLYVDTGALYRTIGYYIFSQKMDPKNDQSVLSALPGIHIELHYSPDGQQQMLLNGHNVTNEIRLPGISLYASAVAACPGVRIYLLGMQRELAKKNNVIMDGRDIGTVVLPHADVKIYLTATPEARAERRYRELLQRGTPEGYESVLKEIQERDYQDIHRSISPLRKAEDAITLDTTEMDFEQSRIALTKIIREKLEK
jgi:cytidylate kinase